MWPRTCSSSSSKVAIFWGFGTVDIRVTIYTTESGKQQTNIFYFPPHSASVQQLTDMCTKISQKEDTNMLDHDLAQKLPQDLKQV